jgi:hypothetical protein
MLSSISAVTRNTNFDSWLKTWFVNPASPPAPAAAAGAAGPMLEQTHDMEGRLEQTHDMEGRLADMARYLQPNDASDAPAGGAEGGGADGVSSNPRPPLRCPS